MQSYNKVILIGHLTHDPQLRRTPKGLPRAGFGLAMNRSVGQDQNRRDEVTFVDIVCWDKLAELAVKYLGKGKAVHIEGRLRLEQWRDPKSGQPRSRHCVIAENLIFLDPPPMKGGSGVQPSIAAATPASPSAFAPTASVAAQAFTESIEPEQASQTDPSVTPNPIDEDMSDEEIDLYEEIDDEDWREKVRELLITQRQLQMPDLESDDRRELRRQAREIEQELDDLRRVYGIAEDYRQGRDPDYY